MFKKNYFWCFYVLLKSPSECDSLQTKYSARMFKILISFRWFTDWGLFVRWRGCQGDGQVEGPGQSQPRRKTCRPSRAGSRVQGPRPLLQGCPQKRQLRHPQDLARQRRPYGKLQLLIIIKMSQVKLFVSLSLREDYSVIQLLLRLRF